MKIEGVIEAVPVTSTNTEPMQYDLTITGTGTMAECNHVMDLLMQDAPDTEEEKYIVKPDPNTASGIIDPVMIDGVRHYLKQNGKKIYLEPDTDETDELERCPDCGKLSVRAKGLGEGGGVECITPGCGYWFCY